MTRLSTLLFPETVPPMQSIATLLCFFDTAAYYLPIESGDSHLEPAQLLQGLCTGYAPAPLGSDRDRFNHLIKELQSSRSEDITRLFSFAKAEISSGQIRDQDESSAGALFTTLHKPTDSSSSEQLRERLWQARLVLKLAEMLEENEAQIRNGLAAVTNVEQRLYGSLLGTGEQDPDELASITGDVTGVPENSFAQQSKDQPRSQADLLISLRIKAWAELFLVDRLKKPACLLATAQKDAAALLIDGCENVFHKPPEKLLSLLLPVAPVLGADDEAAEEFLNRRNKIQTEVNGSLAAIDDFLLETAGLSGTGPGTIKIPADLDREVHSWNAAVLDTFPGSIESSKMLDFYCFPAISIEQLFQRLFHLDDPGTTAGTDYPTGIIAALSD